MREPCPLGFAPDNPDYASFEITDSSVVLLLGEHAGSGRRQRSTTIWGAAPCPRDFREAWLAS